MSTKRVEMKNDVTSFLSRVLAELMNDAVEEPHTVEILRQAFEGDGGGAIALTVILNLLPKHVDGEAWRRWIGGEALPEAITRIHPDRSRSPGASGAHKSAAAKRDDAAREVTKCKERLDAAEATLAEREHDVEVAETQMRLLLAFHLLHQIVREGAGVLTAGPLYAIQRAISPYLQVDVAFEAGLSDEQATALASRRETRRHECIQILDRLDRYAGDQRLELNLQHAILKVVREHHERAEADKEDRRKAGLPSTDLMKRRALRRPLEEQKQSIHPAAKIADVADVFDAFGEQHPQADSSGQAPCPPPV